MCKSCNVELVKNVNDMPIINLIVYCQYIDMTGTTPTPHTKHHNLLD